MAQAVGIVVRVWQNIDTLAVSDGWVVLSRNYLSISIFLKEKKSKQAGAELGQAQPTLGSDFNSFNLN